MVETIGYFVSVQNYALHPERVRADTVGNLI